MCSLFNLPIRLTVVEGGKKKVKKTNGKFLLHLPTSCLDPDLLLLFVCLLQRLADRQIQADDEVTTSKLIVTFLYSLFYFLTSEELLCLTEEEHRHSSTSSRTYGFG